MQLANLAAHLAFAVAVAIPKEAAARLLLCASVLSTPGTSSSLRVAESTQSFP